MAIPTEIARPSWNPLRCGGTALPANLLLMAKLIALSEAAPEGLPDKLDPNKPDAGAIAHAVTPHMMRLLPPLLLAIGLAAWAAAAYLHTTTRELLSRGEHARGVVVALSRSGSTYSRTVRFVEKRGVNRAMLSRMRATHAVGIPCASRSWNSGITSRSRRS